MNLKEIMLANGIDNAVIDKIASEMKANRIYTASEENLDIRYGKLKNEHTALTQQATDLQAQVAQFEALKVQLTAQAEEASKKIAEMQSENAKIRADYALERALMEAKVQDVDYMKFKIKEKHPEGFTLDENGKIDAKKLDPIIYDSVTHAYRNLGEKVGQAFSDGKKIK